MLAEHWKTKLLLCLVIGTLTLAMLLLLASVVHAEGLVTHQATITAITPYSDAYGYPFCRITLDMEGKTRYLTGVYGASCQYRIGQRVTVVYTTREVYRCTGLLRRNCGYTTVETFASWY